MHTGPHSATAHTILGVVARFVRHCRITIAPGNPLRACDPEEIAAIARELMMTPRDLETLTHKSARVGQLLRKMLAALGLDARELSERDFATMRDLQRLCAGCGDQRRCAHELAHGTATKTYKEYCPNAYTLEMLVQSLPRPSRAQTDEMLPIHAAGDCIPPARC